MVSLQPGESVSGWVLDQMIGQGSFATVWKAHKMVQGTLTYAAVKAIATDRLSPKLRDGLGSEVSILRRIDHDNVVKLFDVFEVSNWLFLVMEYCDGGDLARYLRSHGRVPEASARHFMQQLSHGLKELWLENFVHRDLKPLNLLLQDRSELPVMKIADFGFARNLQPQGLAETLCGSPSYMAPEILQGNKYDAKADLWSVGVILYELVVGHPPFNGGNHILLMQDIRRNEARVPQHTAARVSPECIDLISGLLKRSAVERMSFTEFFAHPFLGSGELGTPGSKGMQAETPLRLQVPTISASIMSARSISSGSSEHLPFSMDAPDNSSSGRRKTTRVQSAPLSPVAQPVVVVPFRQGQTSQSSGMRDRTHDARLNSSASSRNSLEDDDDYVIIERTQSASGTSGVRAYSQSAPSKGQMTSKSFKIPPPPSMLVPLVSASPVPPAAMARSLAGVKFTSGLPRGESLKRVAFLLEDLGSSSQASGSNAESLAFRLLALQVLNAAGECFQTKLPELAQSSHVESSLNSPRQNSLTPHMISIADKAEQVGQLLREDGADEMLPDVWDLVYKAALSQAKSAAVDELLGSHCSALRAYAKAGALLYFIFAEGSELPLQPSLVLGPPDIIRLQRYTACIALRHQGCMAILAQQAGKAGSSKLQSQPSLSPRLALPHPLEMSVSAQPPLRSNG